MDGFRWTASGGRIPSHRISWFVWTTAADGTPVKMRHVATMRGHWPGWDATCTCGWESRTGGAIKADVQRKVADHKFDASHGD